MTLATQLQNVRSRGDVGAVAETIASMYEEGYAGIQNFTVPEYLSALARWLGDAPGLHKYREAGGFPESPDWKLVAEILWAAAIYE